MPEREVRPKPGEVWKRRFKDANGRDAGEAVCFLYEEGRKLYRAWFGVPWKNDPIEEDMIDGQNGWKRVYTPSDTSALSLFVPLR